MDLTSVLAGALPALIGGAIGTVIGQRRLLAKHIPDAVEQWRGLSAASRLRIRWAVAHGNAVGNPGLAALAVVYARMRCTLWAQMSVVKYWVFGLVGVAAVILSFVALRGDDGAVYGGVITLAMLYEALTAPGRGGRLERAVQRNVRLAALA